MQETPQQEALRLAIANREGPSICTRAVAGSGKTTTLVRAVNYAVECGAYKPQEIQCVAFNKKIAVELEQRMPDGVSCATLNSVGHRAWMGKIPGRITLDKGKTWKAAANLNLPYGSFSDCANLIGKAKAHGLVPDGVMPRASLMPDTREEWSELIDTYGIELMDQGLNATIEWARKILTECIRMAWKGVIDFDDQLYMSALWGGGFTRYPLVLIDESQDVSVIQHRMLKRMVEQDGGRLIAVGDPNQAIYGFRGAHHDSMNQIAADWDAEWLPLTVSFRCPQAIVREAQRYVPDIEAWDKAPEGEVKRHDKIISLKELASNPITIICRYNRPNLQLAFAFLNEGIGATILGRDLGAGLKSTVKKLVKDEGTTVDEFRPHLREWYREEMSKAQAADAAAKLAMLEDRYGCLSIIINNCKREGPVSQIYNHIEYLFSGERRRVTLTSIHKAKGLEWPVVYFLNPSSIPSRYAIREWEKQQEYNAAYVCVTRAQRELHYLEADLIR